MKGNFLKIIYSNLPYPRILYPRFQLSAVYLSDNFFLRILAPSVLI
jgi:hypothetical protein